METIPVKDFEIYENGVKIGMTTSVMLFDCGQVTILQPVLPFTDESPNAIEPMSEEEMQASGM